MSSLIHVRASTEAVVLSHPCVPSGASVWFKLMFVRVAPQKCYCMVHLFFIYLKNNLLICLLENLNWCPLESFNWRSL